LTGRSCHPGKKAIHPRSYDPPPNCGNLSVSNRSVLLYNIVTSTGMNTLTTMGKACGQERSTRRCGQDHSCRSYAVFCHIRYNRDITRKRGSGNDAYAAAALSPPTIEHQIQMDPAAAGHHLDAADHPWPGLVLDLEERDRQEGRGVVGAADETDGGKYRYPAVLL